MTRTTIAVACLGAAVLLSACQPSQTETKADASDGPSVVAATQIEAGRYLVRVGGCNDCHTPLYR